LKTPKKSNPMTIELIRVVLDFGLVILIWLVQLVIYPSFKFYDSINLFKFHKTYKTRVAIVVMPLMVGQLFIYSYLLIVQPTLFNILGFCTVMLLWGVTFFQFVPLHGKISNEMISEKILNQLINRNWLRTFLWSALFTYSFYEFLLKF